MFVRAIHVRETQMSKSIEMRVDTYKTLEKVLKEKQ